MPAKAGYWILDPNPVPGGEAVLIGPFAEMLDAAERANVDHPEDGSGNTRIFYARLVGPDE